MKKKRMIIYLSFFLYAIGMTAWQWTMWHRTSRTIQEIQTLYEQPSKMDPPADDPVPEPMTSVSPLSESGSEPDIEDTTSQTVLSHEQETDMPEREDVLVEESESKVWEGGLIEGDELPTDVERNQTEYEKVKADIERKQAEYEKFKAEHLENSMSQIPNIVDHLNSLSADEQQAFFKQVKTILRDAALVHGETNMEFLDISMELLVNQLLEAGFERRY